MELRPIQAGGMFHVWRSPDNSFRHSFLKLYLDCEPDKYPGIVIVSDENYQEACATPVKNLQRELPQLLQRIQGQPIAYWWLEQDEGELNKILSGITGHPVFVG